jgi:hypothetical protein
MKRRKEKIQIVQHEHYFSNKDEIVTTMKNKIHYTVPYGVLENYLIFFIFKRHIIRFVWKEIKKF